MNNSAQAKNGFKTFIATLVISLILFGVIYYLLTGGTGVISIESDPVGVSEGAVAQLIETDEESESVFGSLARQSVPRGAVLSETDEADFVYMDDFLNEMATMEQASPSTVPVPETGFSGMTYALIISSMISVLGIYLLIIEPRRRALSGFERKVLRDLK
jgi:hypothetical protein